MDLSAFYGTVSAFAFTLLGLWWVVADRHPEWFKDARGRMAYVVSLHFMIPATMSLLSLVAPDQPSVWRAVFVGLGVTGIAGTLVVADVLDASRRTLARIAVTVAIPVYVAVVVVAVAPDVSDVFDLKPLQVEAFLLCAVLLLGLHAAWFFSHEDTD
ncbi:MAG TPA: hypothetical protein VLI04_13620 [Nocardioidaceae bacterium]|nr:hypothetical protein [Nocardioidaceae bacterium]